MSRISPILFIGAMVFGLFISVSYSLLGSVILFFWAGKSEAQLFLVAYNASFKTLLSLALIIGTALTVSSVQNVIPEAIERSFADHQLKNTNYHFYKRRFLSSARSIATAAEFAVLGFVIFSYCQFPLRGLAESLMIIPACAQYALGAYVGRKLYYSERMIHSLLGAVVPRNLSKERELDEVNVCINALSVQAGLFFFVNLIGYNEGPFLYQSILGYGVKTYLTLPALVAAPALLMVSLYSRAVVQRIYDRSIEVEPSGLERDNKKSSGKERLFCSRENTISAVAKRFRVAFSFAGEKRNYVAKVAAVLADRFGEAAILYDKFHEAEFARRDLGFYLPELYRKESDLVIVIVCSDYREKEWCGLEWDAIFDLLKMRRDEDVMLCRFDRALVKGLYSTAGFLELDDLTVGQAAIRILERLALNEGKPKGYYLSGASVECRSQIAESDSNAASSPAE
jgi:hypothetical protein